MVVIQEKSMTIRRSISLRVKKIYTKIYETIEFKPLPTAPYRTKSPTVALTNRKKR